MRCSPSGGIPHPRAARGTTARPDARGRRTATTGAARRPADERQSRRGARTTARRARKRRDIRDREPHATGCGSATSPARRWSRSTRARNVNLTGQQSRRPQLACRAHGENSIAMKPKVVEIVDSGHFRRSGSRPAGATSRIPAAALAIAPRPARQREPISSHYRNRRRAVARDVERCGTSMRSCSPISQRTRAGMPAARTPAGTSGVNSAGPDHGVGADGHAAARDHAGTCTRTDGSCSERSVGRPTVRRSGLTAGLGHAGVNRCLDRRRDRRRRPRGR